MRSHQARRRTTKRKGGVATVVMALGSGFAAVEFEETRRRRDAGSSSWRRFRGRGASLDLRVEGFLAATLVASPAEGSVVCATCPVPWDGRARCPVWFEGGGLLVVVREVRGLVSECREQSIAWFQSSSRQVPSQWQHRRRRSQVAGGKVACDFKKIESNRFSRISTGSSALSRGVPTSHLTQSPGPKTQSRLAQAPCGGQPKVAARPTHRTFSAGLGGG